MKDNDETDTVIIIKTSHFLFLKIYSIKRCLSTFRENWPYALQRMCPFAFGQGVHNSDGPTVDMSRTEYSLSGGMTLYTLYTGTSAISFSTWWPLCPEQAHRIIDYSLYSLSVVT